MFWPYTPVFTYFHAFDQKALCFYENEHEGTIEMRQFCFRHSIFPTKIELNLVRYVQMNKINK